MTTSALIVEGILTTQNVGGRLNVAPMGPIVHGDFEWLTLRPFQTSTTFRNLNETGCGVFHVVDYVGLIAKAAVGRLEETPPTEAARAVTGRVLKDCCQWFEFRITDRDLSDQRSVLRAEIVHSEQRRPFFGFNRARHAVIEAAILATRIHLTGTAAVLATFETLQTAIEKTGGEEERRSFAMLRDYVVHWTGTNREGAT